MYCIDKAIIYVYFNVQPLQRAQKPLRRSQKPLRRAQKPLWRAQKPLQRARRSVRRSKLSLQGCKKSLRRSTLSDFYDFLNVATDNLKKHVVLESCGYLKAVDNFVHDSTTKKKLSFFNSSQCNNICMKLCCKYYICQKKLLSGDIESNPGPRWYNSITLPHNVLQQRLSRFNLRPFDVGGDGNCFFRAVSHQLYGDPEQHMHVRAAGIAYLQQNPKRFIESNTENSWLKYLSNMSMHGTWSDAIMIQAIADQLQLKITIAETHEHFNEYTIVQPISSTQEVTEVYLGHVGQYHYVSTLSNTLFLNCNEVRESANVNKGESLREQQLIQDNDSLENVQADRQKRKQYMKKYRKQKANGELLPAAQSPASKQKRNEYMKR